MSPHKSHDSLVSRSCKTTWQTKSIISSLPQSLWLPNLAGWWLTLRVERLLLIKSYDLLIMWSCKIKWQIKSISPQPHWLWPPHLAGSWNAMRRRSSRSKIHMIHQPAIKALMIFSPWRALQCLHFSISKNMKTSQWDQEMKTLHCLHFLSITYGVMTYICIIAWYQGISQKGKTFWFLHYLGSKMVWAHCEPLNWLNGGPVSLEKFTIFSLKLVWYSLLKIIKLKLSVSNKKLLF